MNRSERTNKQGYCTIQEAADYVGCSVATIRRRISSGVLPAYRAGSARSLRVKRSDVDDMFTRVPIASIDDVA